MASEGYSPVRRAVNGKYATSRSVRINDKVWEKARRRASLQGLKMSAVIQLLVEGYANGLLELPRIQMTAPPRKEADGGADAD